MTDTRVDLDEMLILAKIQEELDALGAKITVKQLKRIYRVAVNSNKGGVGKTTIVLMLAQALAARGYRVLLVDMDPQCNLSTGCGFAMGGADKKLYSVDDIMGETQEPGFAANTIEPVRWQIPRQTRPGAPVELVPDPLSKLVDLVPGHPNLEKRVLSVMEADARFRLDVALEGVADLYHFVIVDTGPRLDFLTEASWAAVNGVLGVTPLYYNEVEGIVKAQRKILRDAKALLRPDLRMIGAVVNEYSPHRTTQKEQLKDLLGVLGDLVWIDQAMPDAEIIATVISNAWPFSRMPAGESRTRVRKAMAALTDKFLETTGYADAA